MSSLTTNNNVATSLDSSLPAHWSEAVACQVLRQSLLLFALLGFTGCFGPIAMKHDIQSYNEDILKSETQMLLYNVGLLSQHQPPHFMMLANVSQSRTFSATSGFSWAQALSAINPITAVAHIVSPTTTTTTTTSAFGTEGAWTAGPFSTTSSENPTITFVPIQGQDFYNRFESPLRDKMTILLEDERWSDVPTPTEDFYAPAKQEIIIRMFTQSLFIVHGDNDKCHTGRIYRNQTGTSDFYPNYDFDMFDECVQEIMTHRNLQYVQIDGHYPVLTKAGADPSATDVITALGQGYEWTKDNKDSKEYTLTSATKIPAWLNYEPNFKQASPPPQPDERPVLVTQNVQPTATELVYGTPKGYTWKQYTTARNKLLYALVPDGYSGLTGEPEKVDKCGKLCPGGLCASDSATTCGGNGLTTAEGIEQCEAGKCLGDDKRLLYSDNIINWTWPVPQNYFYVEVRHQPEPTDTLQPKVTSKDVQQMCFEHSDDHDYSNGKVVCGFLKIGNFLQIMRRLADMAQTCRDRHDPNDDACKASNIAIGSYPPPLWADRWEAIGTDVVYEPAHNPNSVGEEGKLGMRDRDVFNYLYELYQISLVNTAQLVSTAPAITIAK
jgi:hypothetical protein